MTALPSEGGTLYCDRMDQGGAPFHAHIYYEDVTRAVAEELRARLEAMPVVSFVGRMLDRRIGPHPIAQFEIHFVAEAVAEIVAMIKPTSLRALVHPLTDDDLADHSSLARWIGEALLLDLSVLDPPGCNQGLARFGRGDF